MDTGEQIGDEVDKEWTSLLFNIPFRFAEFLPVSPRTFARPRSVMVVAILSILLAVELRSPWKTSITSMVSILSGGTPAITRISFHSYREAPDSSSAVVVVEITEVWGVVTDSGPVKHN